MYIQITFLFTVRKNVHSDNFLIQSKENVHSDNFLILSKEKCATYFLFRSGSRLQKYHSKMILLNI